ncbi:MAG TPA: hypothetical protein VK678_08795 [Bradyrhizobium sp.]|nr:hypothetical protein [Bradyrhizobium sp.]
MTSSTWPRWPTPWSLECLVFTSGIGEHSKEIRQQICNRLRWLGVTMDPSANDQAKLCIEDLRRPLLRSRSTRAAVTSGPPQKAANGRLI